MLLIEIEDVNKYDCQTISKGWGIGKRDKKREKSTRMKTKTAPEDMHRILFDDLKLASKKDIIFPNQLTG